jgi:hypothetical protein
LRFWYNSHASRKAMIICYRLRLEISLSSPRFA